MKLKCPHCGLKGTANDSLIEKKVRCPQCQKVFRLQRNDAVNLATGSPAMQDISADTHRQDGTGVLGKPNVGTCSICGFSLSSDFLETRGDRIFCRICLPN